MIRIKKERVDNIDIFSFHHSENRGHHKYNCDNCKEPISNIYIEIIDNLKEKGLLQDNFPLLCCYCRMCIKEESISLFKLRAYPIRDELSEEIYNVAAGIYYRGDLL